MHWFFLIAWFGAGSLQNLAMGTSNFSKLSYRTACSDTKSSLRNVDTRSCEYNSTSAYSWHISRYSSFTISGLQGQDFSYFVKIGHSEEDLQSKFITSSFLVAEQLNRQSFLSACLRVCPSQIPSLLIGRGSVKLASH